MSGLKTHLLIHHRYEQRKNEKSLIPRVKEKPIVS